MPSRHNAHIIIEYNEAYDPFNLFLTGFGAPDDIKRLVKLSVRAKRRAVMQDPEQFAVNLFEYALKRTTVWLNRRESVYAWNYYVNMLAPVPTIRIMSEITGERETVNFFDWIGPERRQQTEPVALRKISVAKKHRGRPSLLSKDPRMQGQYQPVPDYVDSDGEHFNNNRTRRKP